MHLYRIEVVIYFCEVFQCYTFPQCQYLDEENFLRSLLFSGVALLNWFTKSSKFEGYNDNELFYHFLDFSTYDIAISVCTTSQKVLVA